MPFTTVFRDAYESALLLMLLFRVDYRHLRALLYAARAIMMMLPRFRCCCCHAMLAADTPLLFRHFHDAALITSHFVIICSLLMLATFSLPRVAADKPLPPARVAAAR